MKLPHGVALVPLQMNRDQRGWVTEIFRAEWPLGVAPRQWNATLSQPTVLRGMHVHRRQQDYLVVLDGRISVGLFDARPQSPTYRLSALVDLSDERLEAVCVPTGVLHGYYCHESTVYVYGVDRYYDPTDESAKG